MLFAASPSHQLGVMGIVCCVHPLREIMVSRDIRPLAMETTVSSTPWKPMYATFVVPLTQPEVALPAIGATARANPEQATALDIMPPKLKPVEKIRLSSMHISDLNRSSIARRNAMSWPFVFPQPRPLPPKSRPSGDTRIAWLFDAPLSP